MANYLLYVCGLIHLYSLQIVGTSLIDDRNGPLGNSLALKEFQLGSPPKVFKTRVLQTFYNGNLVHIYNGKVQL
jgi:hypothetical protein